MQNKTENIRLKSNGIPTRKLLELDAQIIIRQLEQVGMLCKDQFQFLIQSSISVLKFEPNVLKTNSPAIIVGDIHGFVFQYFRQFYDLLTVFRRHGLPPQTKYVFLGDYVDRGQFSIEVLTFLIWLKLKYPKNIYLLRGNHQCRVLTNTHNFKNQCKSKYNIKIYELVIILFQVLPICCIVDNKYFCVHAGISPSVNTIEQIQKISRFCEIPQKGALCDLLWSDPTDQDKKQWLYNATRSCSYFYSKDHALNFMKKNSLEMIIRGHQVQLEGYKYLQFKRSNKKNVLTIFSAPHYCDKYNNLGAVAMIQNNDIRLDTYKNVEHPYVLPNNMNIFQWSIDILSRQAVKILIQLAKNRFLSQKPNKQETDKLELCKQMEEIKRLLQQEDKSGKICKPKQAQYMPDAQYEPNVCLVSILMFICQKKCDEKQQGMPINQEIKNKIKDQERRIYSTIIQNQPVVKKSIEPQSNIQHIYQQKLENQPTPIQYKSQSQFSVKISDYFDNKDGNKDISKNEHHEKEKIKTQKKNEHFQIIKQQKNCLDSNIKQQHKQNTAFIFGPKISEFAKICAKKK